MSKVNKDKLMEVRTNQLLRQESVDRSLRAITNKIRRELVSQILGKPNSPELRQAVMQIIRKNLEQFEVDKLDYDMVGDSVNTFTLIPNNDYTKDLFKKLKLFRDGE